MLCSLVGMDTARIVADPTIMAGMPTIRSMRITGFSNTRPTGCKQDG